MRPGVPLPETCSNYYELLGVPPFESDASVINSKVRELMREARKYQVGQYATQAERHLNLLASATACLSNPQQKQAYDEELRRQWGLPPVSVAAALPANSGTGADSRPAAIPLRYKTLAFVGLTASLLLVAGLLARSPENKDHPTPSDAAVENLSASRSTAKSDPSRTPSTEPAAPVAAEDRPVLAASHPPERKSTHAAEHAGESGTRSPMPSTIRRSSAGVAIAANQEQNTGRSPAETDSAAVPAEPPAENRAVMPRDASPPAPEPKPQVRLEFDLSGDEVIRELKSLRLKRSSAGDTAWRQALRLVRYGQAAFPDDKRFLKQLQAEITALRRAFPQLRDSLKDVPR